MISERKGFSLTEVLVALLLGGVAIAGMTRFFIAQFHQYYLITNNNGLNYDLRTMAKYLERDIRSSIEFTTTNPPNASLRVLLDGTWNDGSGFSYSIQPKIKSKYQIQSLVRTPCKFNGSDTPTPQGNGLVVAEDCVNLEFYTPDRPSSVGSSHPISGTRRGIFVNAELRRGAGNQRVTTYCRLFFHSRNPKFN
ncbi:MAG: prepilin-type N-terminal cleavage/methylation domain-containing protein [Puniceicoccales bacterium]|jgi:prepilin-type N-terminal cleavage/methylation domain-containing protein|nr:prepilin-type N-terminal cleavage/methylation domain-containing protein [Puniceicoccales bacterium]